MFVDEYLSALESSDQTAVLRLFTEGAVVHSPLYGTMPAADFYPLLFEDTAESRLRLRSVLTGEHNGASATAFWFDFDWVLADGTPAPFTVVDIAELNAEGLITTLHIVYDTATVRPLFEKSASSPA